MLVHFDFGVVVQVLCLVQGLTTAGYLLLVRPRPAGARWLALLLLGVTLQVADYFLSRSGLYFRHRALYFTPLFFSWGFGPLLLNWVRARYGERSLPGWHFGPVAAQVVFYAVLAIQPLATKAWFWQTVHKPVTRHVEHYGALASLLLYVGAARHLLLRQHPRPRRLEALLAGGLALVVVAALDPLFNAAYLPAGAPRFYLASLGLPALAYGAALLGWLGSRPGSAVEAGPPAAAAAPALATLPAAAAEHPSPPSRASAEVPTAPPDARLLARVVRALADEQLYHDPDLTLGSLARHLGLTTNAVSQLVNTGLGQSFTDWVNGYRLAEVEQRLLGPDARRLTLLALALDAGFNSKTTFNRVFKARHGLTPSQYQKKYQTTLRDDAAPAAG